MKSHKNEQPPYSLFRKVATTPDRASYKWKDGQPSILAMILMWFVWIFRICSLLQWLKHFFRTIGTNKEKAENTNNSNHEEVKKSGTKVDSYDKGSKRRNIPPWFTEVYFLVWGIVIALFYFLKLNHLSVKIITIYYLVESAGWVAYYTIFRRFFEEKYSLYHSLENLVILILLFATQMFAFTNLLSGTTEYENSLIQNLLGILGAGWDKTYPLVKACGVLNSAIVIGMIINNFPSEKTKSETDNEEFIIIGKGDVVINRLYPAISKANFKDTYIDIFDLKSSNSSDLPKGSKVRVHYLDDSSKIVEEIKRLVNSRTIIFLSTPSDSHHFYIEELYHLNCKVFVVEKPIECNKRLLNDIQESIIEKPELRSKFFFLSYYYLEKALPLTYFLTHNEAYLKYLYINDEVMFNELSNHPELLGKLKKVTVSIKEEEEQRHWVRENKNGGQLLETFIHNVTIASLLLGDPHNWKAKSGNGFEFNSDNCSIKYAGSCDDVEIDLFQSKSGSIKERFTIIEYENATIKVDLNEQILTLTYNEKQLRINIINAYKGKYDVQLNLVRSVYEDKLSTTEADGLGLQFEILNWLIGIYEDSFKKDK